ncbi:Hsp20/alpha crystallin family protein [Sinosporangium siamense]|uniref:Heat-shock protein n=1 Tax=Sinosporangium siamense TaxID=1367973 RepID=A0A919RIL6_9ACTN|nr:Hsp20/alpha crystallin family protein [Sinosporangium siamense]GII93972.1 heat-shock protein [Sinosporangium siamense]
MPMLQNRRGTQGSYRLSPIREFEDVYDHLGRLMTSALGEAAVGEMPWSPLGDISETEDSYVIEVDLPGMSKEQIDVQVNDREISVSGEVMEKEHGRRHHKTRRTGRFEYRVVMPGDIDPTRVAAQYDNGVLTINVPKAEVTKPRHIEISG